MDKNNSDIAKKRILYELPSIEPYNIDSTISESKIIEAKIDKCIRRFRKKGVDIGQCFDYLYSIVDEYISTLDNELEHMRRSKKIFLEGIILRRSSYKKDFEQLYTTLEEEIAKTQEEIDFVKMLYEKCNPLYQGRLNLKSIKLNLDDDTGECEDGDPDE